MTPTPETPVERRRFEFEACLGAGGFGEVYLAKLTTESGLERRVAVKLLHGTVDLVAVRRLRDEARLLAALNHRAILQVHDLVDIEGRTALVTEYIDGLDLAHLVGDSGGLPPRVVVEIVGEVAGALNVALTAPAPETGAPLGLVHRDIKPGNIRIAKSGGVKLLDFGIAVSSAVKREAKTGTGLVIGTLGYLAPERVSEEGVFPPSDMYALGCVLFEALVGAPLFEGVSQQQMIRQSVSPKLYDAFLAGRTAIVPPECPPEVRALLDRLLVFAPEDRPAAADVERICDDLASGLPGPNVRRWARDRAWPEVKYSRGSLDGRRLEGETSSGAGARSGQTFGISTLNPIASAALAEGRAAEAAAGASSGRSSANNTRTGAIIGVVGGMAVFAVILVVGGVAMSMFGGKGETAVTPTVSQVADRPPVATASQPPSAVAGTAASGASAEAAAPLAPPPKQSSGSVGSPPAPLPVPTSSSPPPSAPSSARSPAAARSSAAPSAAASASPAPSPPPAARAPGTVSVAGGIPVEIRGGGHVYSAGSVPAGTYEVWADFGTGFARAGSFTLAEGGRASVLCSGMVMNCKVAAQ